MASSHLIIECNRLLMCTRLEPERMRRRLATPMHMH